MRRRKHISRKLSKRKIQKGRKIFLPRDAQRARKEQEQHKRKKDRARESYIGAVPIPIFLCNIQHKKRAGY